MNIHQNSDTPITEKKLSTIAKALPTTPFYDTHMVSDYDNKNVIYIGYIGTYESNKLYYKFGISNQIFKRDVAQHRKTFNTFKIIHIVECNNNSVVEAMFKKELHVKRLLRQLTINNKTQTELFTLTNPHTIATITAMLNKLVKDNELQEIVELKKEIEQMKQSYALEIERERTKQIEATTALELKREETKLETIKLEILKLQLQQQRQQPPQPPSETPMQKFIKKTYIITNNNSDKVQKDKFTRQYNKFFKTNKTWSNIINSVKRYLTYDRNRCHGTERGVIVGIKQRKRNK